MTRPLDNNQTRLHSANRPGPGRGIIMPMSKFVGVLLCWLTLIGCLADQTGDVPAAGPADIEASDAVAASAPAEPGPQTEAPAATDTPAPPAAEDQAPATEAIPPAPEPRPVRPVKSTADKLATVLTGAKVPKNKPLNQPELPPQAQKAVDEAREFIAQGLLERARSRLDSAKKFAPRDLTIRRLLGQVFFMQNNMGKARQHLMRVLGIAPDDLEVQVYMGCIYDHENNRVNALKTYRTALLCTGASPDNPLAGFALYRTADLLEVAGEFSASLDAFDVLSEWVEQNADVYAADSHTAELVGNPAVLLVRRGMLLVQSGYGEEAVELLALAHELNPSDMLASKLLLEAYGQAGQYDQAAEILTSYTGSDIRPVTVQLTINGVVSGFADDGAPEDGLFWLAELIVRHPEWAPAADVAMRDVLAGLVSVQFHREFIAGIAADESELRSVLHYLAGRVAEGLDLPNRAAEQFSLSIGADATFVPAHEALIYASISQGRHDVAMRVAERLLTSEAPRWLVAYLRGKAVLAGGDLERAVDLLNEARSLRDDYQPIYLLLADAYRKQGTLGQAGEAVAQAIKLDPTTPGLFRRWLALHAENGTILEFAASADTYLARQHGALLEFQLMLVHKELLIGKLETAEKRIADLAERYPSNLDVQLLGVYASLWAATARQTTDYAVHNESTRGRVMRRQVGVFMEMEVMAEVSYYQRGRTIEMPDLQIGKPFAMDMEVWAGHAPAAALTAALDKLKDIRANWPDDRGARLMTVQLLSALGETEQAIDLWQSLHVVDPSDMRIIAGYSADLMAAERYVPAVDVLTEAAGLYPSDQAIRQHLTSALMQAEQFEDAIALLSEWLGQTDGDSDWRWRYRIMLVHAYQGARMFQPAQDLLDTIISEAEDLDINTAPYEKEKLTLHILAGDLAEGIALIKRNLAQWLRMPGLLVPDASTAADGIFDDAFVLATRPVTSDGLPFGSVDYDGVLQFARKSLAAWADKDTSGSSIVGMLIQLGHHDEAIEVLSAMARAGESTSERDVMRWRILIVYALANRYDAGHDLLDSWISDKLEVSRRQYNAWKVVYYMLAGRHDDALAFAHQWRRRDTTSFAPRYAAIFLLTRAKRHEELVALVDEWDAEIAALPPLADGPASTRRAMLTVQLRWTRMEILSSLGRFEDLVDILTEWLQDEPENVAYLLQFSIALDEVGRIDDSIAAIEAAYALHKSNWRLKNQLAYALARQGVQLGRAERLIGSALRQEEWASLLDTRAWVYYKQGKVDRAVRDMDRVLAMVEHDPAEQSPVLWDHAGDAHYRKGDSDRAVELWQEALSSAQAEDMPHREVREILETVPAKLQAVQNGQTPPVSPLGEDVDDPLFPSEEVPADDVDEADSDPPADAAEADDSDPPADAAPPAEAPTNTTDQSDETKVKTTPQPQTQPAE